MKKFILLATALVLATTALAQSTFESSLPAKAKGGATIYGVVEADGKPMQGVAVSDGYEVVLTDKAGCYSIRSEKRNGNVFITIPSGYEVPSVGAVPCNWARLTAAAKEKERHDFTLKAVDQSRHAIFAVTDIHLSNRYNDIYHFNRLFLSRLNKEKAKFDAEGIPTYTICMGDSSFDLFWYDFLYDIGNFRSTINENYPTQFFNSMGNHDNDPSTDPDLGDTDFRASAKYRDAFGPTYYSFNIGDIHYVMLDDIFYKNEKRSDKKRGRNVVGARNYDHTLTDDQLAWLKKDLALVADKTTPIVIAMHCPVYRYKNFRKGPLATYFKNEEVTKTLSSLLADFSEVHFLSGHTHKNRLTYCNEDPSRPMLANTIDHNIAAVGGSAGSWWMCCDGGTLLCSDGCPAGFEVFTADNKQMKWYYTSLEEGADKQFRTFDMNSVRDLYRSSGEIKAFLSHYPERTDFGNIADNQVYINVWAWDNTWKISVKENGVELKVARKTVEHPQYTLAHYVPKTVWNTNFNKKYGKTGLTRNMFVVTASAPDTTLEIEVTDHFGKVYRQTMIRPKAFTRLVEE